MAEREVHCFHTRIVTLGIADTMVASFGNRRFNIQFFFQQTQERFKEINMERIGFFDDFTDFIVYHADKSNRTIAKLFGCLIDFIHYGQRFFRRIDKWINMALKLDIAELVQQGFTDIFGGQTGAVGNIEDLAWSSHNESFRG